MESGSYDHRLETLVERHLRHHLGELQGSYAALLDEPGGLELIGAAIRAEERRPRR